MKALVALERLLLPNACVSCGRTVGATTPDSLVCAPCLARLRSIPAGCERCGQPLPPVGPCRFCADWPRALQRVTSAVWLGDEARQIVHHLKYQGYKRLADDMARKMVRLLSCPVGSVLVPVPLGPKRLRQRGYNQADLVARSLGEQWKVDVHPQILARERDTKSQTKLTPEERRTNVGGAFVAAPPTATRGSGGAEGAEGAGDPDVQRSSAPAASSVSPPSVILVDDVLTTGATLAAAATALQEAGWHKVEAVTFARALPFVVRVELT